MWCQEMSLGDRTMPGKGVLGLGLPPSCPQPCHFLAPGKVSPDHGLCILPPLGRIQSFPQHSFGLIGGMKQNACGVPGRSQMAGQSQSQRRQEGRPRPPGSFTSIPAPDRSSWDWQLSWSVPLMGTAHSGCFAEGTNKPCPLARGLPAWDGPKGCHPYLAGHCCP